MSNALFSPFGPQTHAFSGTHAPAQLGAGSAGGSPAWLQPFEAYLSQFPTANPMENQRFLDVTKQLNQLYQQLQPGGLSPEVQRALQARSQSTDGVTGFLERADERSGDWQIEHKGAQKPDESRAPTQPAVEKSADPSTGAKTGAPEAPAFDGRYRATAKDALGGVEKGGATLGLGEKGESVREVQKLMEKHGAKLAKLDDKGGVVKNYGADGFFGEVTAAALRELQKSFGLPETGKVDAKTLERLRGEPKAPAEKPAPAEKAPAPPTAPATPKVISA